MKKILNKFKANLRTNLLIVGIGFGLGLAFFFLYIFVLQKPIYMAMSDASFIVTAIYFSVAVLMLVAYFGFFDTFAYGFISVGNIFFRPFKVQKKYEDLIDYKEQKSEKRKSGGHFYLPFFLLSIIGIISTTTFYILYIVYR